MEGRPQILILSGFLGSGKTTLLVQLVGHLQKTRGRDFRIAIIENEIGSVSVDTAVIGQAGYSVTEMLSGCVCCTLAGQLVPGIQKIARDIDPDLVVLEATGVASPGSMRETLERYGKWPVRVVALADASRWHKLALALGGLLADQITPADAICLNKCDLADQAQLQKAELDIRALNAHAPLIRTSASMPISAADLDLIAGV